MSDWKEESNKRRDIRHTKDSDEHRKESSVKKKNTKKWCKGKAGREHKSVCMTYAEAKLSAEERNLKRPGVGYIGKSMSRYRFLVCTSCGKELAIYYGFKSEDKPDWVTK
jgi:hypothetical protein